MLGHELVNQAGGSVLGEADVLQGGQKTPGVSGGQPRPQSLATLPQPCLTAPGRQVDGCSYWVQTKQEWLPPSRSPIERKGRQALRREAAGGEEGEQPRGLSVEGAPA